jgi:EAL domain-containing protein (putative c-di-GMP-specific phosphodiesterase class I)
MPDHSPSLPGPADDIHDSDLYGPAWVPALAALQEAVRLQGSAISARFYDQLGVLESGRLIKALTEAELQHLISAQARNVLMLASPDLTAASHHEVAQRVGRIHAAVGLTQKDLLHGQQILQAAVRSYIDVDLHSVALSLLSRRLIRDLVWQNEVYQQLQAERYEVLLSLSRMVWDANNYTDLISQSADLLGRHAEIAACSFGKPDHDGVFQFEFMAGDPEILSALADQVLVPALREDDTHPQGMTGRAWHSGNIQHCVNFQTDERLDGWHDEGTRLHVRSLAAIPIGDAGQPPRTVLALYSRHIGGYASPDQKAFIRNVQSLLEFAFVRLDSQGGTALAVPYTVRQRWARLIRSDALQMHYQPILDLKTGRIVKVEALVRLKDGDQTVPPAAFLPALSSDDLFELYSRGLDQALAQYKRWLFAGLDFRISVNMSARALADPRYLDATREAMLRNACPAHRLEIEILETEALPADIDVSAALGQFKALGIDLAEDDLGSGHSSLTRLRQLPFDTIKIDRDIVGSATEDLSQALRFIYQLTRLGHSLGKTVIVEGVEDQSMLEAIIVLGSDAVQGFVIARPMPAEELTDWAQARTPIPLPISQAITSTPAKLAALLLWEERLHLTLGEGSAARATEPRQLALPFDAEPLLQHGLASAAVVHGMRSAEYADARRRLVESL